MMMMMWPCQPNFDSNLFSKVGPTEIEAEELELGSLNLENLGALYSIYGIYLYQLT